MSNPDFESEIQAAIEKIRSQKAEQLLAAKELRLVELTDVRERLSPFTTAASEFFEEAKAASEDFGLLFGGTPRLWEAGQLPPTAFGLVVFEMNLESPVMFSSDPSRYGDAACAFFMTLEAHPTNKSQVHTTINFLTECPAPYLYPMDLASRTSGSASTPRELKNALQNAFVDFIAARPGLLEQERAKENSILSRAESVLGFRH